MDLPAILVVLAVVGLVVLPVLHARSLKRPEVEDRRRGVGAFGGCSATYLAGGDRGGHHDYDVDVGHYGDAGGYDAGGGGGDGGGGGGGGGD
jgi:hypothetical protein